jgi:rhamnosyltransferase
MALDIDAKRIAIYFMYDKDGVVDDYIMYQLNDLKENIHYLLVVVNGILTVESWRKLAPIANEILVRKNEGFDVWAYKEGIEYIGWDSLKEYDELLLMNFTCFGPLYPFKEAFDAMNGRDIDFWGLTKFHQVDENPFDIEYGYIPEHIQSHFICVRKSMFSDHAFKEYWDSRPVITKYEHAIGKHEAVFTKKFEDMGFKSDVYVNTEDLREHTDYPLMTMPLTLIRDRRCPIFKRKSFTYIYKDLVLRSVGEPIIQMYEYIKDNLSYNLNMVWDNLLRAENFSNVKNRMHLNYVLPKDCKITNKKKYKAALIYHIYFDDLIDESFSYISNMPSYADIYITTNTEKKKALIMKKAESVKRKVEIIIVENRGRDVSALLVASREIVQKYEYICFAHDKKTPQLKPFSLGKSFSFQCTENVIGSETFIENVLETMESNERLGLLFPPPPSNIYAFSNLGHEWGGNYNSVVEFLNGLNIKVPISEESELFAPFGTMFWFKPKALEPLFKKEWSYSDFSPEPNETDNTILHVIERSYPFCVQASGYYLGWLMHDKFAAIALTNYHYMLRDTNKSLEWHWFYVEKLQNDINWHIDDMKAKEAYIGELTAKTAAMSAEIEKLQDGINWHIDDMKAKQAYIEELTARMADLTGKGIKWHIKEIKIKIARKLQKGIFRKQI